MIQRQIVLPWEQVLRIAYNSIRVRFTRCLITTLTLVLAVSFVSYTWSTYAILNSLWPHASNSLQDRILSSGFEISAGRFGSNPKDLWLALLSLLVCVVGIVNAQLMAVTERYREIGTFKCLGALNSFVVRIFVVEALYQGLVGGIAGSLVGILISTLSLAAKFGPGIFSYWPAMAMATTFGWSCTLAVVLSLLGVIYPAIEAARMPPAIALRNEE